MLLTRAQRTFRLWRNIDIRRWALALAVGLTALALSPAVAHATLYSHNVAYVYDDVQFPCTPGGNCGMNDGGSSIFMRALTGLAPGSGDTGTYTPATGTLGAVNLTNVPISSLTANPSALGGFDTAIVYEPCAIGQPGSSNALAALNSFVSAGGKLLIFDADACSSATTFGPADWSGFLFPFATNSPGPQGASGSYDNVIPSALTSGLASGPQPGDAVGDANVFTTYDGRWYESVAATNVNGASGIVQAYATAPSGGLAIYDGEDFWATFGPSPHLQLVFDNMLNQTWNPSGLPNTFTASGITLTPSSASTAVGSNVALTARVADPAGNPRPGIAVSAKVTAGPDQGTTLAGTTDGSGQYTFTLTTGGNPGLDVVIATYVDSGGQTHTSNASTVSVTPGITVTPGIKSPRHPTQAIVFVSGLDSNQSFADPAAFRGGCTAGTWGKLAAAVARRVSGNYQVFDAPLDDSGHPGPDCPKVQASPPHSLHEDTHDFSNQDTNGTRLVNFLEWLNANYSITDVWLVGHSYGGIWSRSALTQMARVRSPLVRIKGIITVGTPETGSFGADLYSVASFACRFRFLDSDAALACAAAKGVRAYFGAAINGLTHASLTAWNAGQTQQTPWGGCVPVVAVAGTEYTIPYLSGLGPLQYVTPNDGIVGEQSAEGWGPGSSITYSKVLTPRRMVHIPELGPFAKVETNSSYVQDDIVNTVLNSPGSEPRCQGLASKPKKFFAARAAGSRQSIVLPLTGLTSVHALRRTQRPLTPGTVVLADSTTRITCHRTAASTSPLLGLRTFVAIIVPRCRGGVGVVFGGKHRLAALARSNGRVRIALLGHGRLTLTVTGVKRGLRTVATLRAARLRYALRLSAGQTISRRLPVGHYQVQVTSLAGGQSLGTSLLLNVR